MVQHDRPDAEAGAIPIALIYWGRRGAGAVLAGQIAEALAQDPRFALVVSTSAQAELPVLSGTGEMRHFPVETFSGPLSFLLKSLRLPAIARRFARGLKAAGVQAAVTVMPHVWGLALQRALRRAGIRTVLMVHDADPHPGEKRPGFDWMVRTEIRGSDRIVTLSDHVAARLLAQGVADPARLTRLHLPILSFATHSSTESHPSRPFRLLFFGRILPYKGVPLLLEAFAKLRAASVDCTLRVVGRGRIEAPAALLDQPGLTVEQGWVAPDDVGGILAAADAIVLPYTEASQSGVIVSAYGAGLPVVTTPVGGLAEQVIDGETGTLAADTSAGAVAEAVRRLIETPGLYAACRAGVARYAEAHSMARFAGRLGDAVLATISQERR